MPPPKKRSYATANLDNGASPASKRRRPIEVIVLSSDSESDSAELHDHHDSKVLEVDDDEVEDNFGAEEVEEYGEDEDEEEDGNEDEDGDNHPEDDVEDEHEENEVENHDDDNGSQESRPRRSLTILEQLQQDAFSDFKLDLRLELDELRPRAGNDASAEACDSEEAAANGLRGVLRQWLDQDKAARCSNHLYYRLDAKYNEAQFPPQVFCGRDQTIVAALGKLVAELPLEIFFALLDRDERDPNRSYLVRRLADRQGHDLVLDIPVDEQSWLQTKLPSLKARTPECEAAVMLVPRESMVDSLMPYVDPPASLLHCPFSMQSLQGFVTYFLDTISEQDNRTRLFPVFKELCARVWRLDGARGLAVLPEDMVNRILKAGVDTQDWGFLEAAASRLGGRPHMGFFYWVGEQVASGGLLLAPLEKSLSTAALTSTNSFDRVLITHQLFTRRVPKKGCEELLKQLIPHILDDLSSSGSCSHVAHILVDRIWTVEGSKELASRLVKIVEKNAAHTSFVLGILECLRLPSEDRPSSPPVPRNIYNQLGKLIIGALDVSKLFQRASRNWGPQGCACAGPLALKPGSSGAVDAAQLANTFSELLAKGADNVAARFATKIAADVGLIPQKTFTSLWLPFLSALMGVLEKHQIPLSTPRYRHLFAAVLETYLASCAGALRYKWIPKQDRVPCSCRICALFSRFLRTSASAASFSSWTESEMDHINRYLVPRARRSHRCQFRVENGVLVVRKLEFADGSDPRAGKVMREASLELEKLDSPALRAMLGSDWIRVQNFLGGRNPQQSPPVPIESLEEQCRDSRGLVGIVRTTVSTSASPPVPAPGGSHSLGAQRHAASVNAHNAPLTPTPTLIVHSIGTLSNRGPPLPATPPATQPKNATGYDIFAHELGVRLRMLTSFATPQSIQTAISKRWEAMSLQDRQHYHAKAASLQRSSGTSAPLAVPFNPHRDPLPSTPRPSPYRTAGSSQSAQFHGSPNVARQHAVSNNRRVAARTPASTPTPCQGPAAATTFQSPPSSRVLAPVSARRLNSVRGPRGHAKIKTEAVPRVVASRGPMRAAVEVIDLTTGDD